MRGISAAENFKADVAQLVERVLGKDEVIGSIPINGSRFFEVVLVPASQRSDR